MGVSSRLIQFSFLLNAGMLFFILSLTNNLPILQQPADQLLGQYVAQAQFRLYILEGMITGAFLLLAMLSIGGVRGEGAERQMHETAAKG